MKNTISFIFFFLSVSVFGQKIPVMQKKIVGNEHHIDVYSALQNKAEILNASQIAEDIEFLPLETTDECLLGEDIMNIVVTSKDIFIYDLEACYRFNRNGKFKNRIGTQGNGPGEYVKALTMLVDTLNQWIYIGDYNQKKFVKYDYEGKHLGDLKSDWVGIKDYFHKPMFFLMGYDFYPFAKKGQRFSLAMYSEEERKIISQMRCEFKDEIPRMAICPPQAYSYKGDTYVKDFFCDTIYRMVDLYHLESYAYVDRGESKLSKRPTVKEIMELGVVDINETDRYIFLTTDKGRICYDKKERKALASGTLQQPKLLTARDELYGSPGLRDFYVAGNYIYTYRYPFEFKEFGNGKHSITDARYDAYRKMVNGLKEDDNPVIMIVKLKK